MVIAPETEKPNHVISLLFAGREGKRCTIRERSNTAGWTTFNSPISAYQYCFKEVFPQDFASFLQMRTKHGKDANVLDLMSPGAGLRQLPLQSGLALTLGDGRTDTQKAIDQTHNIDVVEGNILFKGTWKTLKKKMEMNGISNFGLILCRPEGGLDPDFIPYVGGLYYKLLDRAWDVLSPDGGAFLVELPINLSMKFFEYDICRWVNTLKRHCIPTRFDEPFAICLIKKNNLNPHLPTVRKR